MARLTRFEEYRDRYPDFVLEKTDDGILLMRMHRDGGPAVWDTRTHHDIANLFNDVAGDRDVRVVIYTGTGDTFNASWGQESEHPSFKAPADWAEEMGWYGRLRHINLLEIDAIMIAAVNGVSVLCPGVVASNLLGTSTENRPDVFGEQAPPQIAAASGTDAPRPPAHAMPAEDVGPIVIRAIRANRFLVLTHPRARRLVEARFRAMLEDFDFAAGGGHPRTECLI